MDDKILFIKDKNNNLQMQINDKVYDNIKDVYESLNITTAESLNDIKVNNIYKYKPYLEYLEDDSEEATMLQEIAKYDPYCIVKEILYVSKDENDGFVVISFDVDQNTKLDLENKINGYYKGIDFVVFEEDLVPVSNTEKEKTNKVSEDVESDDSSEEIKNSNTSLLVALDSEKDAVVIYTNLIDILSDNKEKYSKEIQLLNKILDDEKEHIALLSNLQFENTEKFVAKDNKDLIED